MRFFNYIFFVLFAGVSFAQQDTVWFDSNWKEIAKRDASFYRIIKKTDKGFLVSDNYLDGNPQMVAEASQVKPLVKNGLCTYYYKNAGKGSYGYYNNGKKLGTWIEFFNNGKDSSIITFLEDGTKNYIHKSKYEEVFTIVEEMPEFPGGYNEMIKFIRTNITYPKEAEKNKWTGKAFVKFVVNESGNINDVSITKSSGHAILDDEAIRVIRSMPLWKPGIQNNKKVSVFYNLPLNFNLN